MTCAGSPLPPVPRSADDYARAAIPMLPVVAGRGKTREQILVYTLLLLPVSPGPLGRHRGQYPDRSVFCRARHERFRESDALRRVFEGVVAKCIAAGLVGGRGIFIDACLIKAAVDKKKRVPGDQPIAWPKAEEASRAIAQLPEGKVALASAPSASSAALLGTCRGGR
jgi:hypothetical protein